MTQRCHRCGCTNLAACEGGCSWVTEDLCSSCTLTLLTFAGAADNAPSLEAARRHQHDTVLAQLRESGLEAVAPVNWRTYDKAAARDMLTDARLIDEPNAIGLLAWLSSQPDAVLVVTSVDYDPVPVVPHG